MDQRINARTQNELDLENHKTVIKDNKEEFKKTKDLVLTTRENMPLIPSITYY